MATSEFGYQMDLAINELVARLPPDDAAALENTHWFWTDLPTAEQRNSVDGEGVMLALYSAPERYTRAELLSPTLAPPTITLFEQNVRAMGYSAKQVVLHEAGHRLGYDHNALAAVPCGTEYTALPDVVRAVASLPSYAPIASILD